MSCELLSIQCKRECVTIFTNFVFFLNICLIWPNVVDVDHRWRSKRLFPYFLFLPWRDQRNIDKLNHVHETLSCDVIHKIIGWTLFPDTIRMEAYGFMESHGSLKSKVNTYWSQVFYYLRASCKTMRNKCVIFYDKLFSRKITMFAWLFYITGTHRHSQLFSSWILNSFTC